MEELDLANIKEESLFPGLDSSATSVVSHYRHRIVVGPPKYFLEQGVSEGVLTSTIAHLIRQTENGIQTPCKVSLGVSSASWKWNLSFGGHGRCRSRLPVCDCRQSRRNRRDAVIRNVVRHPAGHGRVTSYRSAISSDIYAEHWRLMVHFSAAPVVVVQHKRHS